MSRTESIVVAVVLCALGCGWAATATAQAENAGASDGPTPAQEQLTVSLMVLGRSEIIEPIVQAIRGHLSDLPVSVRVTWVDDLGSNLAVQRNEAVRVARESGAAVVLWYDPDRADRMFMLIPSLKQERFLQRRFEGSDQGGGLTETLGVIARGAVRALIAGVPVEATPVVVDDREDEAEPAPAPEPPEPTQPEVPAPQPDLRVFASGAYTLVAMSAEDPAVQGGTLAIDGRIAGWLYAFVGYSFLSPVQATASGLTLDVRRHPIAVGVRLGVPFEAVVLSVELTGVVDIVTEEVEAVEAIEPTGRRTEVQGLVVPSLRLDVPVVRRLRIFVTVGAGIPLNRLVYVVDTLEGRKTVIETWEAQPTALVGIAVGLL